MVNTAGLFLGWISVLFGLSRLFTGSWDFMYSTYGTMLVYQKIEGRVLYLYTFFA